LDKRNPSAERPKRPEICIEPRVPPLIVVEVELGPLLVVEEGTVVMLVHWTLDGVVKVAERVKSMHYTK
jgi:hypothetical protein